MALLCGKHVRPLVVRLSRRGEKLGPRNLAITVFGGCPRRRGVLPAELGHGPHNFVARRKGAVARVGGQSAIRASPKGTRLLRRARNDA
jgi:hypothetical protein